MNIFRIDQVYPKKQRRESVIQFGSGAFLRGFFDWMLQKADDAGVMNDSAAVVVSVGLGAGDALTQQNGQYTSIARGADGVDVTSIDVIARVIKVAEDFEGFLRLAENPDARFIVSNTTEAGIVYEPGERPACPRSFPARLTALLNRRYELGLPGFILLPCELIEHNGGALKEIVLRHAREWGLPDGFLRFLERENHFLNTLVDRIVSGHPKDEDFHLGYEDALVNVSESYHLWVIEGDAALAEELPLHRAGLNVLWTDDLAPYRTRKVRILNGAHTCAVAPAMLSGIKTVGEAMADPTLGAFLKTAVYEEIIPTLDRPREELNAYARDVFRRFENPYIFHEWRSISLNSVSKFRVRVLPSILEYIRRFGKPPENLTRSLAMLIRLYQTTDIRDDTRAVAAMRRASVRAVLADETLWGEDIAHLTGAVEAKMEEA